MDFATNLVTNIFTTCKVTKKVAARNAGHISIMMSFPRTHHFDLGLGSDISQNTKIFYKTTNQ